MYDFNVYMKYLEKSEYIAGPPEHYNDKGLIEQAALIVLQMWRDLHLMQFGYDEENLPKFVAPYEYTHCCRHSEANNFEHMHERLTAVIQSLVDVLPQLTPTRRSNRIPTNGEGQGSGTVPLSDVEDEGDQVQPIGFDDWPPTPPQKDKRPATLHETSPGHSPKSTPSATLQAPKPITSPMSPDVPDDQTVDKPPVTDMRQMEVVKPAQSVEIRSARPTRTHRLPARMKDAAPPPKPKPKTIIPPPSKSPKRKAADEDVRGPEKGKQSRRGGLGKGDGATSKSLAAKKGESIQRKPNDGKNNVGDDDSERQAVAKRQRKKR